MRLDSRSWLIVLLLTGAADGFISGAMRAAGDAAFLPGEDGAARFVPGLLAGGVFTLCLPG